MAYRRFDKYGIVKRLALGGISEIFLAREDQGRGLLDRHVVIKKLLPQFAGNERLMAVIQREARLLAALYHANIVQVYDAGITEEGEPYLVLEYIQGQDLRAIFDVVREGKTPLPSSMVYYILEQVLRALVHMHELRDPKGRPYNLVHRDLSPTNIMCSMSGDVKLLDFGLARRALDVTGAGNITGKLPYLSPEQLSSGRVDARSDLFALGTVFYELCTGRFRYQGDSDTAIIAAIRDRRDIPLSKAARWHPPELVEIIARACEYDPQRRPASAREMIEDHSRLPAVVPNLHGGRTELVDFMEFHFGATRIDTTLPVDLSPEKPVSVQSFNIVSMDLPAAEDVQKDSILDVTAPQAAARKPASPEPPKAASPRPGAPPPPPPDWFEPLSKDRDNDPPPPDRRPTAALAAARAQNPAEADPDATKQGWKIPPAAPPTGSVAQNDPDPDATKQGWKIPPPPPPAKTMRPPGPAPRPQPGPAPRPQPGPAPRPQPGPGYPLSGYPVPGPPAGAMRPPAPAPPAPPAPGPGYPPPGYPVAGPPPQAMRLPGPAPQPPGAIFAPMPVTESTMPVPPLAFDGFDDETHYLPEDAPVRKSSSGVFSHVGMRVVFPVAGGILLVAALVWMFFPSAKKPQEIRIALETNAEHATAFLDESPLGTLPVTFVLPADGKPHEVRVEAPGKIVWRKTLHPASTQAGVLRAELRPLLAEIKLFSTMPGVEVRVTHDGKPLMQGEEWMLLPLLLSELEPGIKLKIEARLRKKKWETEITVPEKEYQEMALDPPSGK